MAHASCRETPIHTWSTPATQQAQGSAHHSRRLSGHAARSVDSRRPQSESLATRSLMLQGITHTAIWHAQLVLPLPVPVL